MAPKGSSYRTSVTPITIFAHLIFLAVLILVLVWLLHFRDGLSFTSDNKQKLFNLHPFFMVIFILITGEAIMAYKTLPGERKRHKAIHMTLHLIALLCAIVGLYAVFQFHHDLNIADIYSLHSWFGITTVGLFFLQWVFSFLTFWWPQGSSITRANFSPFHVLIGLTIFFMAILAAITGLVEKFIFVGLIKGREALIVNFTGLLLFLFGFSVGFTVLLSRAY